MDIDIQNDTQNTQKKKGKEKKRKTWEMGEVSVKEEIEGKQNKSYFRL